MFTSYLRSQAFAKMADKNGEPGAVGKETINTEIVTLTRFLSEGQAQHREATGDFT